MIKQIPQQARTEVPLQGAGERLFALLYPIAKELREGHAQVEKVPVKERDEVVFLAHDAVGNVVGVEFGGGCGGGVCWVCGGGGEGGDGVLFTDQTDTANDFGPGDRLDVRLGGEVMNGCVE